MVTMTTTGLGGCVPRSSLMRLLVALQQQVSIFYTVVILGMGMTIVIDKLGRLRKEALAAKVSAAEAAAEAAAAAAAPEVDQ
jgi:hypothetical protein